MPKGCTGKAKHYTQAAAERHMHCLISVDYCTGFLNVYRCRHCGMWHVGRTAKKWLTEEDLAKLEELKNKPLTPP